MDPQRINEQPIQTQSAPNPAPAPQSFQSTEPGQPQTPLVAQPGQTSNLNSNQRTVGIVLAIVAVLLLNVNSGIVGLMAIVLSCVGTYLIAKARRINPAWAVVGLLPLVGPAIALFIKPVSSVYGPAAVPGEVKKKGAVTYFIYAFGILAGGILLLMLGLPLISRLFSH